MMNIWMNIWENTSRRKFAAAILAGVVFASAASQQAVAKAQILTQDTVKQFIASFPAVKTIAVTHAAEKGKAIKSTKDNLAAVIAAVSDKSIADQVNKAVKPHGFKDAKEWAAVGESVGRVYVHLKVGADDGAKRKLDKAIAKIEKNAFLNDKQKEQLTKTLRSGAEAALEPPPEENVRVVKPMVADLEAAVK
jgi:hypothetical protein